MTATTAPTATTTGRSRARRWVLLALQVLLALLYVASGLGKVTLEATVVAGFAAMGLDPGLTVTIGVLELLGAVVITAGTRGVGMILAPAVVLALVAGVAWAHRHETAALVRDPRRVLAAPRRA